MAFLDQMTKAKFFAVPPRMYDACKIFAFDQEQGMKIFSIVELVCGHHIYLHYHLRKFQNEPHIHLINLIRFI